MHTTIYSGAILGVDGLVVEVEVDISRGIPCFSIVGLPNTAVRESRERVTAAVKNSGWDFPLERITVNLAPADIKKEGAAFDLAIAVGLLVASGQARPCDDDPAATPVARTLFLGELALDGSLRRIPGVLPILLHARARGYERAVVPEANHEESRVVEGMEVVSCRRLVDVAAAVFGEEQLPRSGTESGTRKGTGTGDGGDGDVGPCDLHFRVKRADAPAPPPRETGRTGGVDMADVRGQEAARRALEIAAAGGHHVLMVGPPGAGKTMLARRFATILPPLDARAALETTMIYSTVGLLNGHGMIAAPPFRAPHHSASDAGLIGGGGVPRPGEVTLAHNGILFLDELPEFRRHVLETLREPLEEGRITIARARSAVTFPARFQLVAAMNPCPCGYLGSSERQCRCSPLQIERYRARISGPLLDRIAVHVHVRPVDIEALRGASRGESSATVRARVTAARAVQRVRFAETDEREEEPARIACNARIPEGGLRRWCALPADAEALLDRAQRRLQISARGRAHIVRVARTIADLEGAEQIGERHIGEAVGYRGTV